MFEGIPLAGLTPAALLGIAVLFIFLGKLVPRTIVDDKIKESDRWREAYEKEREARRLSDSQTAELLETSKTTQKLIEAAFGISGRSKRSEETNDSVSET